MNILALCLIGVPMGNMQMYDDSLSGWVRDSSLPMVPAQKKAAKL